MVRNTDLKLWNTMFQNNLFALVTFGQFTFNWVSKAITSALSTEMVSSRGKPIGFLMMLLFGPLFMHSLYRKKTSV